MRLGVLCSGNLGFQILSSLIKKNSISFVFTDSNSQVIIEFCNDNNVPVFQGNPRKGKCQAFLRNKECDVIFSINYLFLIDEDIINFPKKYAINFHGSLLPKYRGRTPHVWAIINNEKKTGITAHLIDSGCDTGLIIEQIEVPIGALDTGASILEKFNSLYCSLIEKVLIKIEQDKLTFTKQDHSKATFFEKRTPDDGKINWNWQKERIYNWVRAQAHPYPGSFTYVSGNKLTIDRVSFTDDGYDFRITNGTIISVNPLKVKTQNGVIQIDSYREALENHLITNKVLE